MADVHQQLTELLQKVQELSLQQEHFVGEIKELKQEIHQLKKNTFNEINVTNPIVSTTPPPSNTNRILEPNQTVLNQPKSVPKKFEKSKQNKRTRRFSVSKPKGNLEKLIGENLINKIGILIIILGVAIGAKYSIDNNLISPLTRIILGYLVGLGLLGFGIKLKENLNNYSAVLVSGAMAILYFITFLAFDLYALIPQNVTFILMVLFTVFTVIAALNYRRSVIANIGLVGAYAVPFLLGNENGDPFILLSYMVLINTGILFIATKEYWKSLYISSFVITWGIFLFIYNTLDNEVLQLGFSTLFFLQFYAAFLSYKLVQKEKFNIGDILLILLNSFIYFFIGAFTLEDYQPTENYIGLFAVALAILHFIVSLIIRRYSLGDKNLFYFIVTLVLTFVTLAIPIQLNGSWITLMWLLMGVSLFWIGRTKGAHFYEKIAFPVLLLSFISLVIDWNYYSSLFYSSGENSIQIIFNGYFLTSILAIIGYGFIVRLIVQPRYQVKNLKKKSFKNFRNGFLITLFLLTTYLTFYIEIGNYWDYLYHQLGSKIGSEYYSYNEHYTAIWIRNYSLLFFSVLGWVSRKFIRNEKFNLIALGLLTIQIFWFLIFGLSRLKEFRESLRDTTLLTNFRNPMMDFSLQYISIGFLVLALIVAWNLTKQLKNSNKITIGIEILIHLSILTVLSFELSYWLGLGNIDNQYKIGLSILWGVYALFLTALGIWKNKKYIRLGGFALIGLTLFKLFFYDVSSLNTISKTILFVVLGILLLIISFLYNKYKNLIITDEKL